ncbi:MAG: hypothetical protein HAW67_02380 [Endozoicomonadaceae bacterium]|nr:hypothetical protein [Endozoicomonadaceae bacterium]
MSFNIFDMIPADSTVYLDSVLSEYAKHPERWNSEQTERLNRSLCAIVYNSDKSVLDFWLLSIDISNIDVCIDFNSLATVALHQLKSDVLKDLYFNHDIEIDSNDICTVFIGTDFCLNDIHSIGNILKARGKLLQDFMFKEVVFKCLLAGKELSHLTNAIVHKAFREFDFNALSNRINSKSDRELLSMLLLSKECDVSLNNVNCEDPVEINITNSL